MPTKIRLYHETSEDTYDNAIEIFAFCAMHDTVNFMTSYSFVICSSI